MGLAFLKYVMKVGEVRNQSHAAKHSTADRNIFLFITVVLNELQTNQDL